MGLTEGCLICRQIRAGQGEDGAKHSEKCRQRLDGEMRRDNDPRINRSEDKYADLEEELLRAQESMNKKRSAEVARRGGGYDADTPPKTCTIQLIRRSWAHQ